MIHNQPYSFRGFFIFSSTGEISFSQRFSNVESKVKSGNPPVPPNDILESFFKGTVLNSISSGYNFDFLIEKSIRLVVLPTKSFYFSVIPLIIEERSENDPPVEISASFHFLSFVEPIFRSPLKNFQTDSLPGPIYQLILQIMPLGSPIIHDAYFVSQIVAPGDLRRFSAGYQTISPSPVPSWKTSLVFPRQQLEMKIRETVFGSIDNENTFFSSYGELKSIASISYLPDIMATLVNFDRLTDVASHFSVKKIEATKMLFSPPTGITQLLLWSVKLTKPPVVGNYTYKEEPDNGVSFTISITVSAPVKSCSIQLSFPDRGALVKHQFTSPVGQLKMSKRESTIMWTNKFTEGTGSLSGLLNFEKSNEGKDRLRAYINFKSKKKSFSGFTIDKDTISFGNGTNPPTVSVESNYSSESKKYIIWGTQSQ